MTSSRFLKVVAYLFSQLPKNMSELRNLSTTYILLYFQKIGKVLTVCWVAVSFRAVSQSNVLFQH